MRPPTARHHRLLQQPSRLPAPTWPAYQLQQHSTNLTLGVLPPSLLTDTQGAGRGPAAAPDWRQCRSVSGLPLRSYARRQLRRRRRRRWSVYAGPPPSLERFFRNCPGVMSWSLPITTSQFLTALVTWRHRGKCHRESQIPQSVTESQRVTDSAVCHRVTESHRETEAWVTITISTPLCRKFPTVTRNEVTRQ